ncbi:MAG: 3-deoxy-8-phosphooctulonate synthase [Candidatus Brocadiia bacterium]|nr:3-deoxy-8-phosphooctulonate synthase [Planctomycetota bacterium]
MKRVRITEEIDVGEGFPLLIIAGPCAIESSELCLQIATKMREICGELHLPYVFKSSFDKANRTSASSFRGPGIEEGLRVLEDVQTQLDIPVLTDIHSPPQAEIAAEVVDLLQIPAFLSRQTDLLFAAAETGLPINVKKGQFLAPEDMQHVVKKITGRGNSKVLLCERGTCFGYHNLVVDFRGIPRMQEIGQPVIFDATHSTQRPGGEGDKSGGNRQMAPVLAAAAVAAGVDGLFIETHPDPEKALSDASTMLPLESMPELLRRAQKIAEVTTNA